MKKIGFYLVMAAIFYLSNTPHLRVMEPATWLHPPQYESAVRSLSFLWNRESMFYSPYGEEKNVDFWLHKVMHTLFYSALALLARANWQSRPLPGLRAWLFVGAFALGDEVHQYFVMGRSGRMWDVGLDAAAAGLALLIVFWHRSRKQARKQVVA